MDVVRRTRALPVILLIVVAAGVLGGVVWLWLQDPVEPGPAPIATPHGKGRRDLLCILRSGVGEKSQHDLVTLILRKTPSPNRALLSV